MRLQYHYPDGQLALMLEIPPAVCPQIGGRITLAPCGAPADRRAADADTRLAGAPAGVGGQHEGIRPLRESVEPGQS